MLSVLRKALSKLSCNTTPRTPPFPQLTASPVRTPESTTGFGGRLRPRGSVPPWPGGRRFRLRGVSSAHSSRGFRSWAVTWGSAPGLSLEAPPTPGVSEPPLLSLAAPPRPRP